MITADLLQTSTYHFPLLDLEMVFIALKKYQKHLLLDLKVVFMVMWKRIRRTVGKAGLECASKLQLFKDGSWQWA